MLVYVKTNLFESPAQVLVNTVNTVGVMGKGIALQFKKRYPDMFARYQKYCEAGLLTVGKLWLSMAGVKCRKGRADVFLDFQPQAALL